MAKYSLIIKGGTVIDGSGFPMTKADIGISGETIRDIGVLNKKDAANVIDASDKYVMPGVVDITNHSDTHWTLFTAPSQESLIMQGITTIVGGACGSSIAPLAGAHAIGSVQKWVDISKINVSWQSQAGLFDELEKHPIGLNFASLVGHGTLRRNIVGDESRQLEAGELESMKLLLRRSLDEGAIGLSFGLATSHGRSATQEEIMQMASVTASAGKAVHIHLRDEGRRILSAVVEAVNIARNTGAEVNIVHMKAIGKKAWNDMDRALDIINRARRDEHIKIWVNFFPYLRTGSLLYTLLPEWIKDGGKDTILKILKDKAQREAVLNSIRDLTLHYDNILIAEAHNEKKAIGKTIEEISSGTGENPEETLVHLLVVNELGVTIFGRTLNDSNLISIARNDFSIFASDGVGIGEAHSGLTHPRSFGAVPKFLSKLARDGGVISWEEAVKKMTSMPAERIGLDGSRGILKKGAFADIMVFDPDTIKDESMYIDPYRHPTGIEYVFVNGNIAVEKGTYTGALAGKILRSK